ncbi:MAG TPA: hypothetical protein VJ939_02705 [Bacteroidales bacterium]|nr:hypothetical protein [Bacteroidales bacterium]
MLIVADYRYPEQIKAHLAALGELVLFKANGLVYDSISGHPDIFLCETPSGLVVAPNTPASIIKALEKHQINFCFGKHPVGESFPETIPYNAVVTKTSIIHNEKHTDNRIPEGNPDLQRIHVRQGYTRCSLFALDQNTFITSDYGIKNALENLFDVHYFSPKNILLPGQKHGFLGGCLGRMNQNIFFTGRLDTLPNHKDLLNLLSERNLAFTELYDGPLIDGGGLFFLK